MCEPILSIRNHHVPGCGDPPIISVETNSYIGYFENAFGEQWIFTVERESQRATLRGGDVGWNRTIDVVEPGFADMTLSKAEAMWLQACWAAAFPL